MDIVDTNTELRR